MFRSFLIWGGFNAFLAVALGAFGSHALRSRIPAEMLGIYQTSVQYHMVHALGLLSIALLSEKLTAATLVRWSGWMLTAGVFLFCGSLYVLALTGIRGWGAVTPLGGICFLAGWALLVAAAYREPTR